MIIDDVVIKLKAGDGGKGMAVFSRTKGLKGPTGGNGGNGGSIFFEGISDLTALRQFRFRKDIKADRGENGKSSLNDGHNAEDLTLFVPVGTVCKNLTTQKEIEITKVGQRELVAKGGRGGRGNFLFRSSTNTSPTQFEEGKDGQFFEFQLQLKMIADVGFIGFPNVGKSSLLNELTNAQAKVASYPFTTLEPNLGVFEGKCLADIPGLIEGASRGKGLGTTFLKHIEKVEVLLHCISCETANCLKDYQTVRNELSAFKTELTKKPEVIILTKTDLVDASYVLKQIKLLKKVNKKVFPVSIHDYQSWEKLKKIILP